MKPSKMYKALRIRVSTHLQRGKQFHRLNFQEHHQTYQKPMLVQPLILLLSISIAKVSTKIILEMTTRKKLIHQRSHIHTKGKLTMPPAPLMKNTTMRMEEEKMRLFRKCTEMIPSLSQIKKSKSRSIFVKKSTSEYIIVFIFNYNNHLK